MKMFSTKSGLRYYPKGSPEAREHMAKLRAMRGKKKNPLTRSEAKNVLLSTRHAFQQSERWAKTGPAGQNRKLLLGWGIGHATALHQYGKSRRDRIAAGQLMLREDNPLTSSEHAKILNHAKGNMELSRKYSDAKLPLHAIYHASLAQARADAAHQYSAKGVDTFDSMRLADEAYDRSGVLMQREQKWGRRGGNPPMLIMGNPGRCGNPPAYFVIDSNGLEIESIHRGHPMKTFDKALASATAHATRLGRPFHLVVHPYVPKGFGHGVRVTPMFFFVGPFQTVMPDGNVVEGSTSRLMNPSPDYGGPSSRFIRYRQRPPSAFARGSFRTIPIGRRGSKAVVGCPKGEWSPVRRRCRVGMRVQSILRPKRRRNPDGLPPRIANDPRFRSELRAYYRRHGTGPVEVRTINVPDGFPKYMSAWGHSPHVVYDAPTHSNKGKRIHHFGEGGGRRPFLVSSVEKGPRFLAYVGGTFRSGGRWIYR